MSTFKLACPSCRQRIETSADSTGQHIDCPACKARIIIPAPPIAPGLVPIAAWETPPQQATAPKPEPKPTPTAPPRAPIPQPLEQTPAPDPDNPFAVPLEPAKAEQVPQAASRVAVLTPQLKLEIISAVRLLITDKAHWLPGKAGSNEYPYAAKSAGDRIVAVPFASVEATHFSIFGAVLLELYRRNVANTARGRREFLDLELTEAIQEVLNKETPDPGVDEKSRSPLNHDQCLAVLDVLERRYTAEMAKSKTDRGDSKLTQIGIEELARKLERRSPINAEEVAAVVYRELEAIKGRLTALERDSTGAK